MAVLEVVNWYAYGDWVRLPDSTPVVSREEFNFWQSQLQILDEDEEDFPPVIKSIDWERWKAWYKSNCSPREIDFLFDPSQPVEYCYRDEERVYLSQPGNTGGACPRQFIEFEEAYERR